MDGKRVGQLQLIVSIQDHTRRIASQNYEEKVKYPVYVGALIDILQPVQGGRPHEIHGMV